MMPHDLPPWPVVYQQMQRWIRAGFFEIMVEDLRSLLREFAGATPANRHDPRQPHPAVHAGIGQRALDTMGPNAAKVPRCMPPWIRWAICWRCM